MSEEKQMTLDMGGAVADFIDEWKGAVIKCFGTCNSMLKMQTFHGYPHDGGLEDKNFRAWWVYYKCPECGYGHSFSKMQWFRDRTVRGEK